MRYYSYDEMLRDAKQLQRKYTGFIECETIGYSVCGRKIIMLRLGCGAKNIFLSGGIHGRESINTKVLMMLASYYAEKHYGSEMFSKYCFRIVPLVNPDGYMEAVTDSTRYEGKYNHNGVDINRNFPSKLWKAGSISGNYPADQPETRAVISAFKSHPSLMYIDVHSRGECIYCYRQTQNREYNQRQQRIAERIAACTGYSIVPPENEIASNDTGGNSVHYYSETCNMPAITIETVPDSAVFPLDISYVDRVFEQLRELLAVLAGCAV